MLELELDDLEERMARIEQEIAAGREETGERPPPATGQEEAEPAVRDAALIAAAQKVEHYEIAGYGTARTWAELLGLTQVARLLQQTLDEEKQTDEKLTQLAMAYVNPEAEAEAAN